MTSPAYPFAVPLPHRHALERPRLLAATDRPVALVLFRGGAGSGKSTALANWARKRPASATTLWLRLDAAHAEPASFWRLVATALSQALLIDMHEVLDAPERVSPELLTRVLVARNIPIVLALDDAEALSAATVGEIVDVLSVVGTLTIGVATRLKAAFELPSVLLSVDTIVVEAPELEFTVAETAAVLAAAGLPSNAKTVQLVRSVCGGHPGVTRAAFASLRSARKPHFAELRGEILNLVGWNQSSLQLLAEGDPLLAEFMMRSSVLDLVPEAFANDLVQHMADRETADTGTADATREMPHAGGSTYLDRIEGLGFGAWDSEAATRTFRYSTISRNALQAALEANAATVKDAPAPASVSRSEALQFAAEWSASHGSPVQSFFLALACEDYDLASCSAAQGASELLSDHNDELRAAVGALAATILHDYPLLAMILALSYNQIARMRLRAIEFFGITIAGAKRARSHMSVAERVVLDGAVSGAFRITGQGERAASNARIALDGLASLGPEERRALGKLGEIVTVECGISLLYGGRPTEALEAFHRTPHVESSEHGRHALAAMAGTYALMGEMRNAAELVVENSAMFWPEHDASDYNGSLFQLGRAWLALEEFDLLAAQHDKDSLEEHISTFEHWPFFAEIQARIDLFSGNASAGIDRLQAVRRRNRGRADIGVRGRQRLDIALSTLYLSAGRIRQAESVLVTAKAPDATLLIAQARVQLVRDQPEAALVLLVRAETLAVTERDRAEQLALECAAQLRIGQPELAAITLERLVALLEVSGLRTPLALLPVEDLTALRHLASERDSVEAQRVLSEPLPLMLSHVRAIILSKREQVVLRKLVETGSVADIADDLFVSPNTVKTQLRSLYRKLGVSSREDALVVAVTQQLLDTD